MPSYPTHLKADLLLEFGKLEQHGCFVGSQAAVLVLSDQDDMKAVALNQPGIRCESLPTTALPRRTTTEVQTMPTSTCFIASVCLIAFAICGPASAVMCGALTDRQFMHMKELYEYALFAEAPKHADFSYMNDCVGDDKNTIVEKPIDIVDVFVPKQFLDEVRSRFDDSARVWFEPTQRKDDENDGYSPFVIGCRGETGDEEVETEVEVELGLKLLAAPSNVFDRIEFYFTGTEIKTDVIYRDTTEQINIFRGTDLLRIPQIRSNFEGELCIFPLMKHTIDVFCEVISNPREFDDIYNNFAEYNSSDVFSRQKHALTIAGHSLGGSATQYVALDIPSSCRISHGGFEEFKAYAFASPGLRLEQEAGSYYKTRADLYGYLINGDWFLTQIFPGYLQSGQISIFTPHSKSTFCPAHSIKEVQRSICSCLKGEGSYEYQSVVNAPQDRLLNMEPCNAATMGGSP